MSKGNPEREGVQDVQDEGGGENGRPVRRLCKRRVLCGGEKANEIKYGKKRKRLKKDSKIRQIRGSQGRGGGGTRENWFPSRKWRSSRSESLQREEDFKRGGDAHGLLDFVGFLETVEREEVFGSFQ
jgi:hypothetical protein